MVSTRNVGKAQRSQSKSPGPKEENRIEKPVARKRVASSVMESIHSQISRKWAMIESGLSEQWNDDCGDTAESLELLWYGVRQWVTDYVASEPSDLDRLSEEQKRAIVSSLEGLCVQESWDTLVEKVPKMSEVLVAEPFLMALVFRDLHNRIIERPFWYLDGRRARDQVEDDTFGERLEYLHGEFLKTNPIMAEYWIRETVRLSNSVFPDQAPDTTFGRYNQERREDAAAQMADDLLASGPVQSLLKTPANDKVEKERREDLVMLYKRAGDAAVSCHQCSG